MTKFIIKLAVSILLISAYGRVAFSADYFPLNTGDVRYVDRIPEIIGQIDTINTVPYFRVYSGERYSHYCRKTPEGKVYRKFAEKDEVLVYDLEADVGASWKCILYQLEYTVTLVSKTNTIQTAFGVYTDCYSYLFTASNAFDADYMDYLAPDIGLVQISSNWGIAGPLIKTRINGQAIPANPPSAKIIRTLPSVGVYNVPVDSYIKAFFSFDIKPTTVSSETFRITSKKEGIIKGTFGQGDSSSNDIITFFPEKPLPYDDQIEVTLMTGIRDYCNDPLSETYSFSFSTELVKQDTTLFNEAAQSIFTDLQWGDFDWGDCGNDGDQDLIIFGNEGNIGHVEWFENKDGLFEKHDLGIMDVQPDYGYGRNCIRWVDYNNDRFLDFVVAGMDSSRKSRTLFYRGSSDGFIRDSIELPFGYASMDWYDFNGDGSQDLLISGMSKTIHPRTAVYRNDSGYFTMLDNSIFPGDISEIVQWVDLNSDGKKDILALGGQLFNSGLYLNSNGSFVKQEIQSSDDSEIGRLYYGDVSDIDKDGDIDLIIGPYLLKQEKDSFQTIMLDKYYTGAIPKFCDLDYDGYADLLIAGEKRDPVGRNRGYIQVFKNQKGTLSLYKEINLGRDFFIFSGKWVDVNNDGRLDLSLFSDAGFLILYSAKDIITSVESPSVSKMQQFRINSYPNPFNPSTTIEFTLPAPGKANLVIYDIMGRKVRELVSGQLPAGSRSVLWDGHDDSGKLISSGVYFARLSMGKNTAVRKMLMMK
jgi:hypothetical protein